MRTPRARCCQDCTKVFVSKTSRRNQTSYSRDAVHPKDEIKLARRPCYHSCVHLPGRDINHCLRLRLEYPIPSRNELVERYEHDIKYYTDSAYLVSGVIENGRHVPDADITEARSEGLALPGHELLGIADYTQMNLGVAHRL